MQERDYQRLDDHVPDLIIVRGDLVTSSLKTLLLMRSRGSNTSYSGRRLLIKSRTDHACDGPTHTARGGLCLDLVHSLGSAWSFGILF